LLGEIVTLSFILNFSKLELPDAGVSAEVLPYGPDGAQFLKALRQDHWSTHVFRRDGADTIAAIPIANNAPELSDQKKNIQLSDNLPMAAMLVRNAILNYVVSIDRTPLKYDPVQFLAKDEYLSKSISKGVICPTWLQVRLIYEIAVRPVYFSKQKPFLAAIVNTRTIQSIDRTVAQLIADGFNPEGHYAMSHKPPQDDPRISRGMLLSGKIRSISGSTLHLDDARQNLETIDAQNAFLERKAFAPLLQHVFGSDTPMILTRLDKLRADQRYGPNKLKTIETFIAHFAKTPLAIAPNLTVSFSPLLKSEDQAFPRLDSCPKPTYVFDQAGNKTAPWSDGGLDRHGPYTAKVFTPTRPHLCVICLKTHKGRVDEFVHKFINGIQLAGSGGNRNYFEKGLLRKYSLQDVTYEFFISENQSAAAYKAACTQALERHGSGTKFHLALIQIEESFHDLPINANPYFVTKESFLTHQIPVQEFEIETAQKPDRSLAFCLNNMALATYAKLNGIPWLLKGNPTIAHELVIGLGSAQIGSGRLGGHERFVGITTVFSGDGNYHLSSASKAVPFDDYAATFKDTLRATINKVRVDMNWRPRDQVRLIFHASFKRYGQSETTLVKEIVGELHDYEVDFAFLEISQDHPYLLFDDKSEGKKDFDNGGSKGVFAPARAQTLQLSNHESLICLTGPGEVKRAQDGLPTPLLLSIHKGSTFTDLTYLTRQLFAFSCHSWRTFLPASAPVTIQYSDLIANALGSLSQFERWNPDVMIGKIGKTRWFL
jgi:Piwi domain